MTRALEREVQALTERLESSENALEAGGDADLDGLDDAVRRMCQRVEDLPADERQALRPALDGLLDRVNRLDAAVRRNYASVKDQLQAHGKRSSAVRAYGKGALRGPRDS